MLVYFIEVNVLPFLHNFLFLFNFIHFYRYRFLDLAYLLFSLELNKQAIALFVHLLSLLSFPSFFLHSLLNRPLSLLLHSFLSLLPFFTKLLIFLLQLQQLLLAFLFLAFFKLFLFFIQLLH